MMNCQSARLRSFRKGPFQVSNSVGGFGPDQRQGVFPMSDSQTYSSDVAFTPAVKAIQARKGSREGYAQVEQRGGWRTEVDDNLRAFLAAQESMFLATASAD